MKKQKIALVVLLALVLSVCCLVFTACGNNTTNYKITWTLEHVSATVTGYDELPAEVEEGTEISFTLTLETGYEVLTVKQDKTTIKADNGTYKVTVKADTSITVTVNEIISSITVTNPTKLTYYAGETLDKTGMTVTANYATGRNEEVTSYSVAYQNGDKFVAGDTAFTVSYGGASKTIELNSTVVGTVTIKLEGGKISEDILKTWSTYNDYNYDSANGIISWTFDKAFESDLVLPTNENDGITKILNGNAFPFKNWSGVSDGKIAAGTNVNVTVTAVYEPQLLEISSLLLTTKEVEEDGVKVNVPYLVINGKFVAADTAYLYLYEGNDDVELNGPTITKGTSDDFELSFDIRDLIEANYPGKWMDIKFRASFGDRVETQEINLINYPDDFVDRGETMVVQIGDVWYSIGYQTYTPDGTSDIDLKLQYTTTTEPEYTINNVKLEVKGEGENAAAYIIVSGQYNNVDDVDAAKAAINGFFVDLQSKPNWELISFEKTVTINDDFSFVIEMSLANAIDGESIYSHITSGTNFVTNERNLTNKVVTVGDLQYTLCIDRIWTSNLVVVNVQDVSWLITGTSLEVKGDKPYLVINGSYTSSHTTTEIKEYYEGLYFDLENNGQDENGTDASWDYIEIPEDGIIVEVANGIFKVYVSLENAKAGQSIYAHMGSGSANYVGTSISSETITVGGLTYSLGIYTGWGSNLITVYVVEG